MILPLATVLATIFAIGAAATGTVEVVAKLVVEVVLSAIAIVATTFAALAIRIVVVQLIVALLVIVAVVVVYFRFAIAATTADPTESDEGAVAVCN